MGRRRTHNKHLPLRVYLKHGRFWYVERTGKWHDLGRTASEMYRELARRTEFYLPANSLNAVFDRYLVESAYSTRW